MWLLWILACGSTPQTAVPTAHPPPPPPSTPTDTHALDIKGRRQLDKGDVNAAKRTFLRALSADPGDAQAHLGLAAALGRLRDAGHACASGARLDVILNHLDQASTLDGTTLAAMAADPDLATARRTLRYAVIAGADPENSGDLTKILPGDTFYAADDDSPITFAAAGLATIRRRAVDARGRVSALEQPAHWTVDEGAILLTAGAFATRLRARPDGTLWDGDVVAWRDVPRECEP